MLAILEPVHAERVEFFRALQVELSDEKDLAAVIADENCYPVLSVTRVDGTWSLTVRCVYLRGAWWFATSDKSILARADNAPKAAAAIKRQCSTEREGGLEMAKSVEALTSHPANMVPVAVAAFEETWRSRGYSLTLLNVLATDARETAQTRLREAPERDSTEALTLAWGVVWPILEELLQQHGYLADTIKDLIAESAKEVTHLAKSGDGP